MSLSDLLPWLNVLLVPGVLGIWNIADRLSRLESDLRGHYKLDDERFENLKEKLK